MEVDGTGVSEWRAVCQTVSALLVVVFLLEDEASSSCLNPVLIVQTSPRCAVSVTIRVFWCDFSG